MVAVLIVAAALAALTWLVWMPLHFKYRRDRRAAIGHVAKVLPTICAAALAGYACMAVDGQSAYAWLVFAGLCVCVLADWLLGVRFEVGGALFFTGHVLYVLAFEKYRPLSWWCLTVFVLALAALWIFLSHYRRDVPSRLIRAGLAVYCVALAALLGFGLPLPFLAFSRRAVLAALGAALFVLSDLTLCHNSVRKKPDRWHFNSLGVYYLAQFCLALSAFPNTL